ncbi:BatD family protein [Endozoicomonas sp. SCSIO W0465]|uniref:BatD family protein n=1 Tax=Endozoicomonas sp. SCSIO W0465 TaxID=2918516 RepID=UPI002075A8E1|nr:BatD family protein [Endozoicomonas sp. SCSIO W0465]USE34277.1 BatD family protein [Endozoicomonas sp. SCSIO W0465]
MVNRKSFHLLLTTLISLAVSMTAHAAFTASVNRTSLASHETLELTLRTDESSGNAPDLKPLEWSFDILGTRQQSQTSIINGKREFTRDWIVTLAPKQQGTLVIPPIQLGGLQSEPVTVTVSDNRPDDSTGDTGPILMKADVSSDSIYVQQELIFTLKILFNVQLYDDNRLSAMDISDALIQQLGETRKLDTIIDGIRYRGFELKYSIHPQSVGAMIIPSLTFTGVAAEPRDPFGSIFSSGGKPVLARSREIQIEVKPRPESYPAGDTWLPARNLSIQEQWSQPLDRVTVGDAITRTITVDADGLSAAQLPPILMAQPKGVNSYPDKSGTEDRETANGIRGQRTDSIAMIPTRPGKIMLPAIEYTWFDTESGEIKTSRLPATEIDVIADPNANALTPPVVASPTTLPTDKPAECPEPATDTTPPTSTRIWPYLTAFFALLWLATLGLWRFKSNSTTNTEQRVSKTGGHHQLGEPSSEAEAFRQLEAACLKQDVRLALGELKNWCRLYLGNNINNTNNTNNIDNAKLTSLTDCLNQLGSEELNSICNQLSASLYGSQVGEAAEEVQLATLLAVCRKIRDTQSGGKKDQPLGRLYPE